MRADRNRRNRVLGAGFGLALIASLTLGAGGAAAREPNGHASCIGIEMAAISPPGSSEEIPGGAPALAAEVKAIAAELGVNPGFLFALIARLHEGSHEECDAALEPPEE